MQAANVRNVTTDTIPTSYTKGVSTVNDLVFVVGTLQNDSPERLSLQ